MKDAKEKYLSYYEQESKTWPVLYEDIFIETSYGRTFIRKSGSKELPALVLLAGSMSTSLMWKASVEVLSKEYCVYTIDNIYDVGLSVQDVAMKSADDLTTWLNEIFIRLQLNDNVNLLGISYGGWVASQFALKHANKLKKLILIAPAATVLPIESKFIIKSLWMLLPIKYFTKRFFYWLLNDMAQKSEISKHELDRYIEEIVFYKKCFGNKFLINPNVLSDEELKNFNTQTLFLVGENEKMYSAKDAIKRVIELNPVIENELIHDVGHDLFFLKQKYIINRVLSFLGSLKEDRP